MALTRFNKGCGTVECPFYKPKEFKDGVRKEVDGKVIFKEI